MKKFISLLMASVISIYGTVISFAEEPQKNIGKVVVNLVAEFDPSTIDESAKNLLTAQGWILKGNTISKVENAVGGDIKVNGNSTKIDINGNFEVNSDKNEIEVYYEESKSTLKKNSDGEFVLVVNRDLSEIIESMGPTSTRGYYDKYKTGQTVHCNRFNGPGSDDIHYPKSHVKAYTNFYRSDCYHASLKIASVKLKCLDDYGPNPWCNGTGGAAACSKAIGHSRKYHKHSW